MSDEAYSGFYGRVEQTYDVTSDDGVNRALFQAFDKHRIPMLVQEDVEYTPGGQATESSAPPEAVQLRVNAAVFVQEKLKI